MDKTDATDKTELKEKIRLMEMKLNKLIEDEELDLGCQHIINYSRKLDILLSEYQILENTELE